MDDNELQEHADDRQEAATPAVRRRLPGVAAALSRPVAGAGLAHWGGPAPRHEPVDVAGTSRPVRLPTT